MKRLNIFVDETGEFGFGKGSSDLYGVSFTFHNHQDSIKKQVDTLNERLSKLKYDKMIHMSDLIMHRGDYKNFDIKSRKSIFNAIYQFSRKILLSIVLLLLINMIISIKIRFLLQKEKNIFLQITILEKS